MGGPGHRALFGCGGVPVNKILPRILAALKVDHRSVAELGDVLHVTEGAARKQIKTLRELGLVYIISYRRCGRSETAIYAAGDKPDAVPTINRQKKHPEPEEHHEIPRPELAFWHHHVFAPAVPAERIAV